MICKTLVCTIPYEYNVEELEAQTEIENKVDDFEKLIEDECVIVQVDHGCESYGPCVSFTGNDFDKVESAAKEFEKTMQGMKGIRLCKLL